MKWRDYPFKSKVYLTFFWIWFVIAVIAEGVGHGPLFAALMAASLMCLVHAAAEGGVAQKQTDNDSYTNEVKNGN